MCVTESKILSLPKTSAAIAECERFKRERSGVLHWECERYCGIKIPLTLCE
ncbi:MAG TPA: hypothetical protein VF393_03880 [archaeon]